MKKTIAPEQTPSPGTSFTLRKVGKTTDSPTGLFIGMTLDMSWRLAVVVLAPIIIGNKVDISLKTEPWFTVVGMVLAVTGTVLVIRSTVKRADEAMAAAAERSKHE